MADVLMETQIQLEPLVSKKAGFSNTAPGTRTSLQGSVFWMAPEVVRQTGHSFKSDIWSVGCTLYELYTGKILFPGRSNNQMLLLMMELKGRFNTKMIKKAKFGDMYFDELGAFQSVEKDRANGTVRIVPSPSARYAR